MKTSDLTKDTIIVNVTPDGFEHSYLVDHVGRERVSVTVVGCREQGKKDWAACAAIEQQISLDTSVFFVLAGPVIGRLVRSQAWALADAQGRSKPAPDHKSARDPAVNVHPSFRPARPARNATNSMQVDYDADSNLPLGWSWGEDEWPGCDRVLPTAVGPNGERIAKYGDNVYTAGFAYTSSSSDLAARSAAMRACDALAAVKRRAYNVFDNAPPITIAPDPQPPREVTFGLSWVDRFSATTNAQSEMVNQTISALAKEATKGYELTGWVFGRDKQGCWYARGQGMHIVRIGDGCTGFGGPDDGEGEQKIMPILNRLATDLELNEAGP